MLFWAYKETGIFTWAILTLLAIGEESIGYSLRILSMCKLEELRKYQSDLLAMAEQSMSDCEHGKKT